MKIKYTRALLKAALNGDLDNVSFKKDPIFGVEIPLQCPGVPEEILTPINTWANKDGFKQTATELALRFAENFKNFSSQVDEEVKNAGPVAGAETY